MSLHRRDSWPLDRWWYELDPGKVVERSCQMCMVSCSWVVQAPLYARNRSINNVHRLWLAPAAEKVVLTGHSKLIQFLCERLNIVACHCRCENLFRRSILIGQAYSISELSPLCCTREVLFCNSWLRGWRVKDCKTLDSSLRWRRGVKMLDSRPSPLEGSFQGKLHRAETFAQEQNPTRGTKSRYSLKIANLFTLTLSIPKLEKYVG